MTSPGNEDGAMAGADLSYQLAAVRFGLRALQGFGEASEARAVLAHFGIMVGSAPTYSYGAGCDFVRSDDKVGAAVALAIDLPAQRVRLGTGIGYMPPGFALEGAYNLHPHFQLLARGDLLVFLNGDNDHVLQQALMLGGRFDSSPTEGNGNLRNGPFLSLLAGYSWGAVTQPSHAGSGPVVDVSVGYLSQGDDGAGWVRLHGRVG